MFFLSGISGVIFSCLFENNLAVGTSPSINGIIGGHLAFITLNYKSLESQALFRCQYIAVLIFIAIMTLITTVATHVAFGFYAHFGGLLGGYMIALGIINPLMLGTYEK